MAASAVRRAIARWNKILERDEATAVESRDRLMHGVERHGLKYGDRPISTFLRPRFIDAATWRQAEYVGRVFHRSLGRLMGALRDEPQLLDALGVHGALQDLVRMPQQQPDQLWFNRLDGFMDGGVLKLVEFNADSPGGAAFVDGIADVYQTLPVFQEFARHTKLWRRPSIPRIRHCVQRASQGVTRPLTAIVDWREVATVREFEIIRADLERHGLPTVIVDPRDMVMSRGRLTVHGKPVDVVIKRVLVTDLAQRADEVKPLVEAIRKGVVTCLNPPAVQAVTTKPMLALFHEGLLDRFLTPADRKAWRRHIPWTVRLRPGAVPVDGKNVDLLEHVARNRERLVLKPADAYGAEGVILGWHCTQAEWEEHLHKAIGHDFVAQARVAIPTEDYPDADEGRLRYRTMHIEISPYTFAPHTTAELLSRLSASDFLNVKAGGGVVATYVLAE